MSDSTAERLQTFKFKFQGIENARYLRASPFISKRIKVHIRRDLFMESLLCSVIYDCIGRGVSARSDCFIRVSHHGAGPTMICYQRESSMKLSSSIAQQKDSTCTGQCRYKTVHFSITKITITNMAYRYDFWLTKHSKFLAIICELWCVFCESNPAP